MTSTPLPVDITFPYVFDLNTSTLMAGEDLSITDADVTINIVTKQNDFQLEYKQGDADTDQFNVEFIDALDATSVSPFNDMKLSDVTNWKYYPDQPPFEDPDQPNQFVPHCNIISNTSLNAYAVNNTDITRYPSNSQSTNIHSIFMQIIGDHYFSHPLATAPIENDGAIAETINNLLDTMINNWNTGGNVDNQGVTGVDTLTADELNVLAAKRSILEQFLNDAADHGTNGANDRFKSGTDGKTTLTLNEVGDKISFLIHFVNNVTHDNDDTTLLNNDDDGVNKFVDPTVAVGADTNFASFTKKVKLTFIKASA